MKRPDGSIDYSSAQQVHLSSYNSQRTAVIERTAALKNVVPDSYHRSHYAAQNVSRWDLHCLYVEPDRLQPQTAGAAVHARAWRDHDVSADASRQAVACGTGGKLAACQLRTG